MDAEKWIKHFRGSYEEWNKIYDDVVNTWNELDVPKNQNYKLETSTCPWIQMYFQTFECSGI